jgi:hypothetical protein
MESGWVKVNWGSFALVDYTDQIGRILPMTQIPWEDITAELPVGDVHTATTEMMAQRIWIINAYKKSVKTC